MTDVRLVVAALVVVVGACQSQSSGEAPAPEESKVAAPEVPQAPEPPAPPEGTPNADTPLDELSGEPLFKRLCVPPTPPPEDAPADLVAQVYMQASKCRMAFSWIAEREPEIADNLARCGIKTRELDEPTEEKFIACLPEDQREDGKRLSFEARDAVDEMVAGGLELERETAQPAPD